MKLRAYRAKRNFKGTPEPRGTKGRRSKQARSFVIQEHHARRLHYDFRIEFKGVLKSWAITREPADVADQRELAVETEDHPIEYGSFHGVIPAGHYGAGKVKIWDRGTYEVDETEAPLAEGLEQGKIVIYLKGRRLRGRFALIRFRGEGPKSNWLFFKTKPKVVGVRF